MQNHVVSVTAACGFSSSNVDPLVTASQTEIAQNTLDQEALRIMENILEHLISNVKIGKC